MPISSRKLLGFYRARVTEVDIDNNDYGAIRIFCPDTMTDLDPNYNEEEGYGLIAYPANNAIGGRNVEGSGSYVAGTVYVPLKDSWVWIFYEGGNCGKPFYMNAINIQNSKLPPENRDVTEPHKVYTVIKTQSGRTIVVSDSDDVQRVEITGKKRTEAVSTAEGDSNSVYTIDDNQTTILLDERDGKEKILMRSHKGDYIHFDIDEQELHIEFKNDIHIKSAGNVFFEASKDFNIKAGENFNTLSIKDTNTKAAAKLNQQAIQEINVKAAGEVKISSTADIGIKAGGNVNSQSGANVNLKAGANVNSEAAANINHSAGGAISDGATSISHAGGAGSAGAASEAGEAVAATGASPVGERDT